MISQRAMCNVEIHYGGIFKLVPQSVYEGGFMKIFEGIEVDVLNMEWLNSKSDECKIKRLRRFYTIFNKTFVILSSDKAIDKFVRKCVKSNGKSACIYVEGEMEPSNESDQILFDNVIQSEGNRNVGPRNNETDSSDEESDYRSDENFDSDCCSDIESEKAEMNKFKSGKKHRVAEDYDPQFEQDMTFATRQHLKKAIQSHAIQSMRSLKLKKNEDIRLTAVCDVNECPWKILSRKVPNEHTFKISSYNPIHTCCKTFKVKNMKSTWLVEKYISYFKTDPMRNLEAWRLYIIKEIGVDISRDQCYRKLWDYREELLRSNPGSTVILHNDDSTGELRFWGFYLCFAGSKEGFLSGCRKFIGLDGAHISCPHGGVLLTAVGTDPNNKPYLIAYAVVLTESGDTWGWFLRFLKDDLHIVDTWGWFLRFLKDDLHIVSEDYTFMSDKQKGLINAVNEIFKGCEHRFCVRHLWKNMVSAGFKGDAYKDILFKATNATSTDVYKCAMKEMEELDPKAVEWLADKPPTQWSKSHFSTKTVCNMILNNHCESYNNIVLKARQQPILVMLEWIREGMIKRRQKCRDKAMSKWHEKLTPKAMKILEFNMEKVKFCRILKVNNYHFQVTVNEFQYNVSFDDFSCTCRRWQLSGIPCSHILSAIGHMPGCSPIDYVHAYYKVETYNNVYAPVIYGINGVGLWSETNFIPPLPPNLGRAAGRPKHDRRRAPDEPVKKLKNAGKRGPKPKKSKRMQSTVTCCYCELIGHNVKTCQLKKAKELEEEQERELIGSSEFANYFEDVVNTDVGVSLPVTTNEVQEDLITLDEVTIIEQSYSSAIFEDSIYTNGSRNKLQVIKNKSKVNQKSNVTEGSEFPLPSSTNLLSSSQSTRVHDEYIYQPHTTPVAKKQGPSASEQTTQHLPGMNTPTSSAPGVVVGGKRFVQVSELQEAILKKRKF